MPAGPAELDKRLQALREVRLRWFYRTCEQMVCEGHANRYAQAICNLAAAQFARREKSESGPGNRFDGAQGVPIALGSITK